MHVHHRTYERIGHEKLSDLCLLCGPCHRLFHCAVPIAAPEIGTWHDDLSNTRPATREEITQHMAEISRRLGWGGDSESTAIEGRGR
jgi:hypothetical protein